MNAALSIAVVSLAALLPAGAEVQREVFPVPPVVGAAFRSGGLAAFDPFDPWSGEGVKPAHYLPAAATGEDAALLPPGECYDVLPVWTARGFQPHAGTRVLYHPPTMLLFARYAAEDAQQIRAFCEWPPAMWLSESYWVGFSSGVQQVLVLITSWEVPATGAGAWNFRPASVEEFLALPADARRMIQRQSFVIRSGQRSKVTKLTTPQRSSRGALEGATTEAELTVGEDGSTIELNVAPELQVRGAEGSSLVLSSQFQQLSQWGQPWLVEAGTLPGTPPRRVIQVYETLRVQENMRYAAALPRFYQRWTGRALEDQSAVSAPEGFTFYDWNFPLQPAAKTSPLPPGELLPPPDPFDRRDPFALPERVEHEEPEPATVVVPELFGDVPVLDVTTFLQSGAGIPPGEVRAWQRSRGWRVYVTGSASGLAAVSAWLYPETSWNCSLRTALAEARISLHPRGGGATRVVWQGSTPIRAGQRSVIRIADGNRGGGDEVTPFLCSLEMEANCSSDLPGPSLSELEDCLKAWSLAAACEIRPPFIESPLRMDVERETGTPSGVTLCRALGRTDAGDDVVLTIQLRETVARSPRSQQSTLLDLWWRRQLAK